MSQSLPDGWVALRDKTDHSSGHHVMMTWSHRLDLQDRRVPSTNSQPTCSMLLFGYIGRLYFQNNKTKKTQWSDPRPLPSGWEQRHDQKSNRTYYANSATKTTQWTDPRPSIRPGLRRTKSSEKGVLTHTRAKGHDSDKEWFLDLLKIAMVDKKLTADEMYLLQNAKAKLNISESEYRDLVEEAGWTMGDIAEAKTNGGRDLFSKECCICLDGPATYIILDCMHMCLCEECATVQAKGLKNCPECRATVKAIKKTY